MRIVLATLFSLLAGPAAAAVTLQFEAPFFVELDGRYYVADAGPLIGDLGLWWHRQFASMSGCRRAGGGALGANETFLWGDPIAGGVEVAQTVALASPLQPRVAIVYRHHAVIVQVRTVSGDVVCAGEVAAPRDPGAIFDAGFE